MTDRTKVIIAFAVLAVVGCGIIGYGLYRKTKRSTAPNAEADRAEAIAEMTTAEFVREPADERQRLLQDAGRALEAVTDRKGIDQDVRERLAGWIETQKRVVAAIDKKKAALGDRKKRLAHDFPAVAEMQLSPAVVARLRQAVKAARAEWGELTAVVDGQPIDLADACRKEADELASRADKVERELDRRERLFRALVLKAQRADKNAQTKRAGEVHEEIVIKKWGECAEPDPEKKRLVADLHARLASLADRPKRREQARLALSQRIPEVARAGDRDGLARVRPAFQAAVKSAEEYDDLRPLVEKAQRVLVAAEERTAPPPAPSPGDRKWRLTMEIGGKVAQLVRITGERPEDRQARQDKWGQIAAVTQQLAEVDDRYAAALAKPLKVWWAQASQPPEPSRTRQRFLRPDWKKLKDRHRDLEVAKGLFEEVRALVYSISVSSSTKSYRSREAEEKSRILKELTGWIDVLEEQKREVTALSKQTSPRGAARGTRGPNR